jgi:IstB-like ATP binding protein
MSAPIDESVDLLRTLRLPHMRTAAPELLATAKAQRWEPAEAMRALLAEELAGHQASSIRARGKAAGFPTGKTFDVWDESLSSIPAPTQRALRTLEWVRRHDNLVVCGPVGDRQDPLPRSARPGLGRRRPQGVLVQPRAARRPGPPPRRRPSHRQGHPADHARRCHRHRRHRPPARDHRDRRRGDAQRTCSAIQPVRQISASRTRRTRRTNTRLPRR